MLRRHSVAYTLDSKLEIYAVQSACSSTGFFLNVNLFSNTKRQQQDEKRTKAKHECKSALCDVSKA